MNPRTQVDERVTVVTHQLDDDHLIYLVFIAPDRDFRRYSDTFKAMASSLQIAEILPR